MKEPVTYGLKRTGHAAQVRLGTCLIEHLEKLPETVQHVNLFSDCCVCDGQNRNQYVAAALNYVVRTSTHINTVDHKFIETGHTQMEVDSIHSTIERAKKHVPVFHPDIRTTSLYVQIQLTYKYIIELHYLNG